MLDLIDAAQPFALIEKQGRLNLYQGSLHQLQKLHDIHDLARRENTDVVFVLPYHMVRERGFEARGDEPILGLAVSTQYSFKTSDMLPQLPQQNIELAGEITPNLNDADYAKMVSEFQLNEIEKGNVSQTTLSRKFKGQIKNMGLEVLLGTYRKIIEQSGHYMAVLFANPAAGQFILAATPERHLEVAGNQTIMTPIAGTLRKEDRETFPQRLQAFIHDPKEINELFQVLDEEMKIMGLICPEGGTVDGPFLREVGAVVHSEYNLLGKRTLHSIDALRETLHAPTVMGSPIESAARVIAKYEPESRRYYAGEIGVYRQPRSDAPDGDLDAAILIRMAEVFSDGTFYVQSGGGLVRDSVPENEAKESWAKAQGILRYFTADKITGPYLTPELMQSIRADFTARNKDLSPFWMISQNPYLDETKPLKDKTVTIINNEDNFVFMIGHIIKSFGAEVRVVDTFDFDLNDPANVIVMGPGPGDPNDKNHPRMKRLHEIAQHLLKTNRPVFGVCLGHQILALNLGLRVEQQKSSTQGMPRVVTINGEQHQLGFYNSFSPVIDQANPPQNLSCDVDEQGRITAMGNQKLVAFQFHPESVMSKSGRELVLQAMQRLAI